MAYILAPSTPSTLSIRIIELYQQPEIQTPETKEGYSKAELTTPEEPKLKEDAKAENFSKTENT